MSDFLTGKSNRPPALPAGEWYKDLIPHRNLSTLVILLAMLGFLGLFLYYSFLVNVGPNRVAIVMEYRGEPVQSENGFIAVNPGEMGIQLEVWREGLHFVNPIFTEVEIVDIVRVPENHVGYVVSKFGRDLPAGAVVAGEGEKGVLDIVLKPGYYPEYSNKYAYDVIIKEAIHIPPGYVGVLTNQAGPMPKEANQFLSAADERGVQERYLTPGTYFLNPYIQRVDLVNVQSRRSDISDVTFPSYDGFPVSLNCSVEWFIPENNAPITFVMFGEEVEVDNKVILPSVLNFSRMIGSSEEATTFISGETRQKFGRDFQKAIADSVNTVNVAVKETGIRTILPPEEVLNILKDREIAIQQKQQFLQEIQQNAETQKLQVQRTKAEKEKDIVDKNTEMLKELLDRQRAQDVAVLDAQKEFDAAKVELEAARNIASASMTIAEAEAKATLMKFEAEANAQRAAVRAFGDSGDAATSYANYMLTKSLAPRIGELFTRPDVLWQNTILGNRETSGSLNHE